MAFLDVNGSRLYYSVKGEGIPLVFIHPPLLASANFDYQINELSFNYKVITFDIRGHGRSAYSKESITYPLIVGDILSLLDHLRIDKAFICGYSTGGTIVLEYLLTNANRALGGIVISGMSEVKDFYLKQRISLAIKLIEVKAFPLLSMAITWGNSDKQETYKRLHKESILGNEKNIQQYYQYSLEYNCTSRLHKIDLAVLLVYGAKDKFFHRYANILHKKLVNNKLMFLEKEKHQIPTKAALKLNSIIDDFLTKKLD
ncbi:alpha/beta fold hydrolase [Alkalihalobacillus pseudalcaliphilus]|uniref:alpha/beta fold hydrolase n=1 Tax=Alkalihalobacillus pseudalcaliphilus TaxID=79884 RepID=UPI00064DF522|nr:alpha/beta hydrolase [Alkalihalobacillus pseudalcaliphilus]KMK76799.1 alpha/beta hydrolase [Alkalihalobacillus pseudalcaliphilus]